MSLRHTVRMVRSDRLVMAAENSPCDAMAVVKAYVVLFSDYSERMSLLQTRQERRYEDD